MKKSLLLSIVMTLVLVVAMSTATFAWYTAQAQVSADVNNITASSSAGSIEVKIGSGEYGENVSSTFAGDALEPAAPIATLTADNYDDAATWTIGTQTTAAMPTYNLEAATAVPYYTTTISVKNLAKDATDISISYEFASADDNVKAAAAIAVIYGDSVVLNSDYSVSAENEGVYTEGTQATAKTSVAKLGASIAQNGEITLTVIAWFDGWEMSDAEAQGQFSINFDIQAVVPGV